ncbi:MAG: DUF1428 domain-containing protein [Novosphingobium sp.]
MTYYDGFVIPVPRARRQEFIDHANLFDKKLIEMGATRVVETIGLDIRPGKTTDFLQAVAAEDGEDIAFSWIEWPDKQTRDATHKAMESDSEMMAMPMPFDGKRMIFGGFEELVRHGEDGPYFQGFLIPVPAGGKEAYRKMAEDAWDMFVRHGALSVVETFGEDVPHGKQTDMYRAVKAEPGEHVVFSWMTWPSHEAAKAAGEAMEAEMTMPEEMPFDPRRMIWAGFEAVIDLKA